MKFKDLNERRRSINFFDSKKEIEENTIKEIINNAVLAPSAFNIQPWEVIVVKSKPNKSKLHIACTQPKILESSITFIIIGNTLGHRRDNPIWDIKIDNGMLEKDIQSTINFCDTMLYSNDIKRNAMAVRNSSLLAMNIMMCAQDLGIETHPMIGFDEEKIKDLFGIGKHKTVTMLISAGYLKEGTDLKPREKRFDFNEIAKII